MNENKIDTLIVTIEKLVRALEANAQNISVASEKKKDSDSKETATKTEIASGGGSVDSLKGAFEAIPNAILSGIQQGMQNLVAPIQQGLASIGKDLAASANATVKATFEPREQLREIAGRYGEAGNALPESQLKEIYGMLSKQAESKRDAIFLAENAMGDKSAGRSLFENTQDYLSHKLGSSTGGQLHEYDPSQQDLSNLEALRKQQIELQKNLKTQGE